MQKSTMDVTERSPALAALGLELATSVAPGDTSTSIVIDPNRSKQIVVGRSPLKIFKDVAYSAPVAEGAGRPLRLDVLRPASEEAFPLIVFVAGGGFVTDNKGSALGLRTYLPEAGFVVASIEYRTVRDGATYKEGLKDVKSAIRFLRARAGQYCINPAHVGIWGQSAGGYLAAMAAMTNSDPDYDAGDDLEQISSVKAVVDQFGPSDVSRADADFNVERRQSRSERRALYVRGFDSDGSLSDPGSNPMSHIAPRDVRFQFFHGSQDRLISPSQTLLLHNHLLSSRVDSTRYVLLNADHGDLSFLGDRESGLAWSSSDTMDLVVRFLSEALA